MEEIRFDPIERKEFFLAKLGGQEVTPPDAVTRFERYLQDIIDGNASTIPPVTRIEYYLAKISGADVAVPDPVTRTEYYLAKIAGMDVDPPDPITRLDYFLAQWVETSGGVLETVSGSPVHITDALAKDALSVLASIEPIQDLHGYANPWPAGGGKNLLATTIANLKDVNVSGTWSGNKYVKNDVSFDFQTDNAGNITGCAISGTATATATIDVGRNDTTLSAGTYYLQLGSPTNVNIALFKIVNETASTVRNGTGSFTLEENTSVFVRLAVPVNTTGSGTAYPMISLGSSSQTFAPYSNICPISGRTGLSVYVSPTQDQQDATTYAEDWTSQAGTVYGGTVDVVTGVLTVDMVNIPSYNGETINEPWLSSMDEYTPGATPTTGAQVVYKLATPLTYQLTPQEVQMLLGETNVWSSSGDTVSVTYYAEGNANPLQSLNILLGGNYSNPKTADDVSDREALEIILGGNK